MRSAVRYRASRCLSASSSNRALLAAASLSARWSALVAESAFTAFSLTNALGRARIPYLAGVGQAVAKAPHGLQPGRVIADSAELGAQSTHVDVKRPADVRVVGAPHALGQVLLGHDLV